MIFWNITCGRSGRDPPGQGCLVFQDQEAGGVVNGDRPGSEAAQRDEAFDPTETRHGVHIEDADRDVPHLARFDLQ
jgi:hypothetical protein